MLTKKEIDELKIGDKVIAKYRTLSGEEYWTPATVCSIIEPDIEEADEYGIWFHDVVVSTVIDGHSYKLVIHEGSVKRAN